MIQITITVDDQGKVGVTGPIDNVHMCYGLLEVAKDIIRKHQDQPKAVIPPTGDDVRRLSLNR